jgi:hypothetical protein
MQKKVLNNIKALIEARGLEALDCPNFSNTGHISIQHPAEVGELAKVGYNFQNDRYTLTITVLGERIPSQPGRADYFDFYLMFTDADGYKRFRSVLDMELTKIPAQ